MWFADVYVSHSGVLVAIYNDGLHAWPFVLVAQTNPFNGEKTLVIIKDLGTWCVASSFPGPCGRATATSTSSAIDRLKCTFSSL